MPLSAHPRRRLAELPSQRGTGRRPVRSARDHVRRWLFCSPRNAGRRDSRQRFRRQCKSRTLPLPDVPAGSDSPRMLCHWTLPSRPLGGDDSRFTEPHVYRYGSGRSTRLNSRTAQPHKVLHPPLGIRRKRETVTAGLHHRHGSGPATRAARIHGLNASAATSCFRKQNPDTRNYRSRRIMCRPPQHIRSPNRCQSAAASSCPRTRPGSPAPAGDLRDIALSTQFTVHIAATAAAATALSCSPVPPLTPTAPTTWPLCRSGTPPAKIMMRPPLEACIP